MPTLGCNFPAEPALAFDPHERALSRPELAALSLRPQRRGGAGIHGAQPQVALRERNLDAGWSNDSIADSATSLFTLTALLSCITQNCSSKLSELSPNSLKNTAGAGEVSTLSCMVAACSSSLRYQLWIAAVSNTDRQLGAAQRCRQRPVDHLSGDEICIGNDDLGALESQSPCWSEFRCGSLCRSFRQHPEHRR